MVAFDALVLMNFYVVNVINKILLINYISNLLQYMVNLMIRMNNILVLMPFFIYVSLLGRFFIKSIVLKQNIIKKL